MTSDVALELSIEQLLGALSKKLSQECTRIQVEFPPKSHTLVTTLIAEVNGLEKRARDVLDEAISMRNSLWSIDHLPSPGSRDGLVGNRQMAEQVSPTSVKKSGAQAPVWEHLTACSLSADECTSCATAYTSLIKAILCDHGEAGGTEYLDVDGGQSFINAIDKTLDKLAPWLQKKCLCVLREVCGHRDLLPNSVQIPVCYNRSDTPLYRGGHADVWKIKHQGRYVAVKEPRIYSTSNFKEMTSRFCKEVVTWKTLRHPNVLPLLWVTMEGSRFAMASEWMANGNINEFVEANRGANRVELLKDAAKGLIYMHAQEIIHGNLKGANILVDQSNRALLAGFGSLNIPLDTDYASFRLGTDAGAARWMSPELLHPERFDFTDSQPTKQSDYYALGMVVLEVLSGKKPFGHLRDILVTGKVIEGERPTRPEGGWFTDDLWETLKQCWSPRPKDRPTVGAILERLEHISMTLRQSPASAAEDGINIDAGRATPRSSNKPPVLLESSSLGVPDPTVIYDGEVSPLEAANDQPHSHYPMTRTSSGRPRTSSAAMFPPMSRQVSVSGFKSGTSGGFTMGNFSTPTSKMTSEERSAISQRSTSPRRGMPFGKEGPMTRMSSRGGPGSNRMRSQRGSGRNESNEVHAASVFNSQTARDQAANFEPVAPLEVSANRWTRGSPAAGWWSVVRKVTALLNKLTMEKFDSLSDQIIAWANKSETERDGRTLICVIRLVYEKAIDEAAWSGMYARLCRKMMETISPNVQDDGIRNTDGKPIAGGQLFRKYLLNRCQEDFENGWAVKAPEGAAVKKATGASGEAELYSDEHYAAQKAKRRGLGLIQFIGELYKMQMLTERTMHECIKKLLRNVGNPEEEEIESLCRLLTTVGKLLDNPKVHAHMDIYFARMEKLGESNSTAPRLRFMLQDLIELRERKWVPRNQILAPTAIAQDVEESLGACNIEESEVYFVTFPQRIVEVRHHLESSHDYDWLQQCTAM